MKSITEYGVNDSEQWNSIVRSFDDYDVFYLNEYVTAFMKENSENGEPILLYYVNGRERAVSVMFKRDVAEDSKFIGKIEKNKYYDLISPYGYGGFIGEIENYEMLNEAYHAYCISKGYICEFIRFELFSKYYANYDGKIKTHMHNVIRNLEMPLEDIWMDFKHKVRKNVKRAVKNKLRILIENNDNHIDDFLYIYYSTMERNDAEDRYYFSRNFFETINQMRENITYFYVLFEEKIISAELVIYGTENCYSFLGGTNKDYFELRPNDFLKYEIIKWACNKKLKNYVLGGGYGLDDGIFQYKTCLAPNGLVDFFIGEKIFNFEQYDELMRIRLKENPDCCEAEYFPQYRA